MVGIIDYLAQCKLLEAEERDPQQWYKCTSARLRDASESIKAMLASQYFDYMNTPKTAEIYWTLVDSPIEGENNSKPKANFQKISACQRLRSQMLFTELRNTEIKAGLMDDPTINRRVKRRFQVASQRGSGKASLVVPTAKCLEMGDDATLQAICCRPRHPRLAHANSVSVELHPNGTTRRAGRPHSEREHQDRCALPRLQMLWHL